MSGGPIPLCGSSLTVPGPGGALRYGCQEDARHAYPHDYEPREVDRPKRPVDIVLALCLRCGGGFMAEQTLLHVEVVYCGACAIKPAYAPVDAYPILEIDP